MRHVLGHTIRTVKMDRGSHRCMVDKSHDSLRSLLHVESRAWRDAIVSNKISLAEVWVDLLLKGLYFDLVVVDLASSCGICVRAEDNLE